MSVVATDCSIRVFLIYKGVILKGNHIFIPSTSLLQQEVTQRNYLSTTQIQQSNQWLEFITIILLMIWKHCWMNIAVIIYLIL